MKTSIVLVNIGTPNSPEPDDVGKYLKQFLMDPDVIDLPFPLRWFLVNCLIVPKRKHQSSHAYKKIWTDRGSPLMYLTEDLVSGMNSSLAEGVELNIAMRYGAPSIPDVLEKVSGSEKILILPMFPQYADATIGSVSSYCRKVSKKLGIEDKVKYLPEFYQDEEYINSLVETVKEKKKDFDHLLFSYHGLPVKHIEKADVGGRHCLKSENCCDSIQEVNKRCYRAQCFATTRAVVKGAGIDKYSISFQSRLGRAEWIRPYTDETIEKLAQSGVKRLGVICPAFLIDCLETLEEIEIGIKQSFLEAGGESFTLIPCLNAESHWAKNFSHWIQRNI